MDGVSSTCLGPIRRLIAPLLSAVWGIYMWFFAGPRLTLVAHDRHRDRLAVIYLRQSSMAQVREHAESTTRQAWSRWRSRWAGPEPTWW